MGGSGLSIFLITALGGALSALALTPLVRLGARTLGVVAHPSQDRWHSKAIPLLGGIAICAAVLIATLLAGRPSRDLLLALGAGVSLLGVGIVDDVYGLRAVVKLTAQIGVASILVSLGVSLHWTASPSVNAIITILWIVGTSNAFNLLDNMDGLCAGIALVTALALCWSVGEAGGGVFVSAAAVAGATAGFLVYNFKPASIFMGDAGSLFLGSTLGVLAVLGEPRAQRGVLSAMAVPVLLMLIPIFDTTFVTLSRKLSRRTSCSSTIPSQPSHLPSSVLVQRAASRAQRRWTLLLAFQSSSVACTAFASGSGNFPVIARKRRQRRAWLGFRQRRAACQRPRRTASHRPR